MCSNLLIECFDTEIGKKAYARPDPVVLISPVREDSVGCCDLHNSQIGESDASDREAIDILKNVWQACDLRI